MDDLRGYEKFIYFLKMVSCNEKPTPVVRNSGISQKFILL